MEDVRTEIKSTAVSIIRKAASRIGLDEGIPHKKVEVIEWVDSLDDDDVENLHEESQAMVEAKKLSRRRATHPEPPLTRGIWSDLLPGDQASLVHDASGTRWDCVIHDQPAQGQLVVKLDNKLILMVLRGDTFCCAKNLEIKLTLDQKAETQWA